MKFKIVFLLAFAAAVWCMFQPAALAEETDSAPPLQEIIGIDTDAYYSKVRLLDTPAGTYFEARIDDPSRLGVMDFQKGDRVGVLNMGGDEWLITHLETRTEIPLTISKTGQVQIARPKADTAPIVEEADAPPEGEMTREDEDVPPADETGMTDDGDVEPEKNEPPEPAE